MRLTLTTWNINSVRLRIDLVARFVADHAPDVLCLQETKCPDDQFPLAAVGVRWPEGLQRRRYFLALSAA
jgi:exodeoxyribonuclease III